jgi:hypothetical protein
VFATSGTRSRNSMHELIEPDSTARGETDMQNERCHPPADS